MPFPSLSRRAIRPSLLCGVAALSLLAPMAQAANAQTLLYERTLMSEAGARCRLFTPAISQALSAARAQARGAALRGGADPGQVGGAERRARAKADAVPCDSRELALAAARVRIGFKGYATTYRMRFPGLSGVWSADRTIGPRWRLLQNAAGGVRFGMAADARGGESLAVLWPGETARGASAARLVVRDPLRAPAPYVDARRRDLAGGLAPRSATRTIWASSREPAPATLAGAGGRGGTLFRFTGAAVSALEALDPRESVALELVVPTRDGERVAMTLLEVGDFAAGRAFLAAR